MAGKNLPVSPLAVPMPEMPPVAGVLLGAATAEIRYKAREDVTMMAFPAGTTAAGVFTRNKCPGAPVEWCRDALRGGKARALVVTAGNSNVFTGRAGRETCEETAKATAGLAGCKPREVVLASTGVIGERLPTEKLTGAPSAYWARIGDNTHLRWVIDTPEDRFLDALARLHVQRGAEGEPLSTLGAGTKFAGFFRAYGLVVPVWDLADDATAEATEEPLAAMVERFEAALAETGPLDGDARRARAGLMSRQVTLR